MASSTQARWQHLIKKGRTSGFDTVKIALADQWEARWGRDEIVTNAEYNDLLKKLPSDYKKYFYDWMDAFKGILEMSGVISQYSLKVQLVVDEVKILLVRYCIHEIFDFEIKRFKYLTPEIVTEKQLSDLKDKQRKELLKEETSLIYIVVRRAEVLLENVYPDREDIDFEFMITEGSPEEQAESAEFFRTACAEIHGLIKNGKLSISNAKNAMGVLKRLQQIKSSFEIAGLYQIASYTDPAPEYDKVKPEPFLEKCLATGESLYQTSLPEWVKWIDEYKHNYDQSAPYSVAVIQDPSGVSLDEKGYYQGEPISQNAFFASPDETFFDSSMLSPRDYVQVKINYAKDTLKFYYFVRSLIQIFTDMTGVNFCEEIESEDDPRVEASWKNLETVLKNASSISGRVKEILEGMPDLEKIDHFKPSPEVESFCKKRLSEYPLGYRDWFYFCREFWLKEKFKTMPEDDIEFLLSHASKSRRKELMGLLKQAHEERN